jgi:hypothetical protein
LQIYLLIHSCRLLLLILIPLILSGQIIKRTAYTKIQITVTFFLLILKTCLQKKNFPYI